MFNKSGNLSSLTSLTSYGDYLVIRKSNMICLWKPSHDIDIKQALQEVEELLSERAENVFWDRFKRGG